MDIFIALLQALTVALGLADSVRGMAYSATNPAHVAEVQRAANAISEASHLAPITVAVEALGPDYAGLCCLQNQLLLSPKLEGKAFLVVAAHELGHYRLGHHLCCGIERSFDDQLTREIGANAEGMLILQEFWGFTKEEAYKWFAHELNDLCRGGQTPTHGHNYCVEAKALERF